MSFADNYRRTLQGLRDGLLWYQAIKGKTPWGVAIGTTAGDVATAIGEEAAKRPYSNNKKVSTEAPTEAPTKAPAETTIEAPKEDEGEYIEFSYEPGDTFGQKILDLGIATDNGLWGEDGDVAFYTQQLRDGGYLDEYGNIRLYTPIKLKVRK